MKEKTYRLEAYYLFDHSGIQRRLADMAAKGWLLDKLGSLWRYRRIDPEEGKRLRFAVTYFPEASAYDPEPRNGQWDYQELCRDAGWTHAATLGQMQVFYTEAEDPVPLETDPQIQVENIHRTMRRSQVPAFLVMIGVSIAQLCMQWRQYHWDPVEWLCRPMGTVACLCWLMLTVLEALSLADYFRWHRRAVAEAREGRFTPTFSRVRFQIASLLLILAVLALVLLSSLGTRTGVFGALFGLIMMTVILGGVRGMSAFLKRKKVSATANLWFTTLFAIFFCLGITALLVAGMIRLIDNGWLEESHVAETYTAFGITWEVYDDPIPLRVEDLVSTDYDQYSTKRDITGSFLLAQTEYRQDARVGDSDPPELRYTVVDVKRPSLYGTAEEVMRKQAERYNQEDLPEFWDYYIPVDPAPWGANRAYQIQSGGQPTEEYLLCYEDRIVELDARYLNDGHGPMTEEQMRTVREILG